MVHHAEGIWVDHFASIHARIHDVVVAGLHAVLDGAVQVGGGPWQNHPAVALRLLHYRLRISFCGLDCTERHCLTEPEAPPRLTTLPAVRLLWPRRSTDSKSVTKSLMHEHLRRPFARCRLSGVVLQ